MRCRVATFLAALLAWALALSPNAKAGPWPQEPGAVFLSFGVHSQDSRDVLQTGAFDPSHYGAIYGELGLGRRLTFGLDLGQSSDARLSVAFLRYTLTQPEATWQLAVDAGYGARFPEGEARADLVRLGASIGRGFGGATRSFLWREMSFDGGWVTLDVQGLYDLNTADLILQAEGTLGMSLSDTWRVMIQVKAEQWHDDDPMLTLSPSVIWGVGERTSVQFGAKYGLQGSDAMGMVLSLWQQF